VKHPGAYTIVFEVWSKEYSVAAVDWLLDVHGNGDGNTVSAVAALAGMLANPNNTLYGLRIDGQLGGMVGVLNQSPITHSAELAIYFDPLYKYRGLGRRIGKEVLAALDSQGFKFLRIYATSKGAENMCAKLGFKVCSMDTVPMTRELGG
jgi:GNAT superfamily N-acetyltransferase